MIGIQISGGFLDLSPVDITCPYCGEKFADEKYLERCNKNKSGVTKIKCACGNTFKSTFDIQGDWHSWKKEDEPKFELT